ncbi:hypothetical protein ACHAWF_018060, partial [Thalassiosira exigua]
TYVARSTSKIQNSRRQLTAASTQDRPRFQAPPPPPPPHAAARTQRAHRPPQPPASCLGRRLRRQLRRSIPACLYHRRSFAARKALCLVSLFHAHHHWCHQASYFGVESHDHDRPSFPSSFIMIGAPLFILLFIVCQPYCLGFVPGKVTSSNHKNSRIIMSETMLQSTFILTSSAAKKAMEAAEQEASANGWSVTIVISDAGGVPLLAKRCSDAFPASYEIAVGKAKTAAQFRKPTGLLEDSANVSGGNSRGALLSAPFVLMRGGVPIFMDGLCIGSVGVSGVKPDEDEKVALAAVNAVASNISKL